MGTIDAPSKGGEVGCPLPPKSPSAPASDSKKLIIALDFGTTFSGIAYCFPHQRQSNVVSVLNWPGNHPPSPDSQHKVWLTIRTGAEGNPVPKIPTVVAYTKDHPSDKNLRCIWGAQVKDDTKGSIRGLKLLLDPLQAKPWYFPKFIYTAIMGKQPKPTLELAADFIAALYSHALDEIAKTVPDGYLASCEKEFVLSVPAVWSDKAKDSTMKVNIILSDLSAYLLTFLS